MTGLLDPKSLDCEYRFLHHIKLYHRPWECSSGRSYCIFPNQFSGEVRSSSSEDLRRKHGPPLPCSMRPRVLLHHTADRTKNTYYTLLQKYWPFDKKPRFWCSAGCIVVIFLAERVCAARFYTDCSKPAVDFIVSRNTFSNVSYGGHS